MSNNFIELILNKVKNHEISSDAAYSLIRAYNELKDNSEGTSDPGADNIAIIGIACRFPQADSKEEYWNNLVNGVDSVRNLPESRRMDTDPYIDTERFSANPYFSGGYLDDISGFDNSLFDISDDEAKYMDPQHRIFMEMTYEAIEDAGYSSDKINGTSTGVFVGNSGNEYAHFIEDAVPAAVLGNAQTFLSGRVSYTFDFKGPSMMINSACSSSLVAIHMACKAIMNNDCQYAIAGGVTLFMMPVNNGLDPWNLVGITSSEEKCKAFDESASGIARGEGCGVILLKSLHKAIADRDNIYAVIKGSAVNQDGHSNGITSPNPLAQAELIKSAWKRADIDPETITYIEAHGTGTKLGDPIEVSGITMAFQAFSNKKQFCAIGSSKSNIGHLADGAGGMAAIIKTVLATKYGIIPPSLHFNSPNRFINFINSPLYVSTKLEKWDTICGIRRAGVSSFGLSGTNCHIVLEEAPAIEYTENSIHDKDCILTVSAQNLESLKKLIKKYLIFIDEKTQYKLRDICYTSNIGRNHYQHRIAIACREKAELIDNLKYISEMDIPITCEAKGIFSSNTNQSGTNNSQLGKNALIVSMALQYTSREFVDWDCLYSNEKRYRVPLPTYAFNRKRHWVNKRSDVKRYQNMQISVSSEEPKEIKDSSLITGDESIYSSKISNVNLDSNYIAPSDYLEEQVCNICSEILGKIRVGVNDNFFELGGQSIKVVTLVSEIHRALDVEISLGDIFAAPRIKNIADYIRRAEKAKFVAIKPIEEKEYYELSSAQKRIFAIEQLGNTGTCYNMCGALLVEGSLDIERLEKTMKSLVQRHEAFRTSFLIINDKPVQKIQNEIDFAICYWEAKEDETDDLIQRFISPFNLSKAPLLRVGIIKLAPHRNIMLFDMHHIISDGTSMGILIKEFICLYEGKALPELEIKYHDFAVWQNELLNSSYIKKQESYWINKFSGDIPTLIIPTDYPRPEHKSFEGNTIIVDAGVKLTTNLNKLSGETSTTLYMVLLAAFNVLLSKYSGQDDIVIGSPIAGRNHANLGGVIGMFVNTLAMRNHPKGDKTFKTFLYELKENTLKAFENQDYQFEEIINKLSMKRKLDRNPLFDVCFVLQNMDYPDMEIHGLKFTTLQVENKISIFDIRLDIREFNGSIKLYFEYCTKLFKAETIERMAKHYIKILDEITTLMDIKIKDIDLEDISTNEGDMFIKNIDFTF